MQKLISVDGASSNNLKKIKNVIKSFDDDRMTSIEDSFHRESIFVTVHTRNIGEVL